MARSKRKTPVIAITTATSEKDNKLASHRKIRRAVRKIIPVTTDSIMPFEKELTNTYSMSKDGKLRFDPKKLPKLLRK
jgi:hypothetical protein